MINNIGKITIYVNNQDEALEFWTQKCNFVVKFDKQMGPQRWIEVAPSEDSFTTFVLYSKETMLKQFPDANVAHPSVILSTRDITSAHEKMKSNDVEVSELNVMPYGSMFDFKDQDGNEYLLREDK